MKKSCILILISLLLPIYSTKASCYDTLGLMSQDNYDGTCSCMRGYTMQPKSIGGGYECVSKFTVCRDQYGYNSSYNLLNDSCECGYGYIFAKDIYGETQCVDGDAYCRDTLGYNSDYSVTKNACVCDDGYTIREGKCQKEAYSTYGVIKQLKDNSAIVVFKKPNSIFDSYYRIDFRSGCREVSDFILKVIVLNLMYDEKLNLGDYLVLPETRDINGDAQHCEISYADEINETDSLYTCEELFGPNSYEKFNGDCYCKNGYEFIDNKCVKKEDKVIYSIPVNNTKNIFDEELEKAITRMYINGLTKYTNSFDFGPNSELTREQASKFFSQYSMGILKKKPNFDKQIKFNDIQLADTTLQGFVVLSTALSLFQGTNGYFNPFNKLTQAQAIAVIIRARDGYKDESGEKWYSEYYNTANNYGILEGLGFDINQLDKTNITRGDVALLLYRLLNK